MRNQLRHSVPQLDVLQYTQFQKDHLLIKSVLQSFAKRLNHVINIKRCFVISVNSFTAEHMEISCEFSIQISTCSQPRLCCFHRFSLVFGAITYLDQSSAMFGVTRPFNYWCQSSQTRAVITFREEMSFILCCYFLEDNDTNNGDTQDELKTNTILNCSLLL